MYYDNVFLILKKKRLHAKRKMKDEMLRLTHKNSNVNKNEIYKNWKTVWDYNQLRTHYYKSLNEAD